MDNTNKGRCIDEGCPQYGTDASCNLCEDECGPLVDAESCHHCNSDDMNWDSDQNAYVCGNCGQLQYA